MSFKEYYNTLKEEQEVYNFNNNKLEIGDIVGRKTEKDNSFYKIISFKNKKIKIKSLNGENIKNVNSNSVVFMQKPK